MDFDDFNGVLIVFMALLFILLLVCIVIGFKLAVVYLFGKCIYETAKLFT